MIRIVYYSDSVYWEVTAVVTGLNEVNGKCLLHNYSPPLNSAVRACFFGYHLARMAARSVKCVVVGDG